MSSLLSWANAVKWYRSTFFNITILGLCNFAAPGIWGAMNSLGAGGAASPHLINAANSMAFCLMVVSCYFSSVIVHYIGIKGALIFGTYVQSQIRSGTSPLTIIKCRLRPICSRTVHKQPIWDWVAHSLWSGALRDLRWRILDGRSCYRNRLSGALEQGQSFGLLAHVPIRRPNLGRRDQSRSQCRQRSKPAKSRILFFSSSLLFKQAGHLLPYYWIDRRRYNGGMVGQSI